MPSAKNAEIKVVNGLPSVSFDKDPENFRKAALV